MKTSLKWRSHNESLGNYCIRTPKFVDSVKVTIYLFIKQK